MAYGIALALYNSITTALLKASAMPFNAHVCKTANVKNTTSNCMYYVGFITFYPRTDLAEFY